jgi:hypothetical protein
LLQEINAGFFIQFWLLYPQRIERRNHFGLLLQAKGNELCSGDSSKSWNKGTFITSEKLPIKALIFKENLSNN